MTVTNRENSEDIGLLGRLKRVLGACSPQYKSEERNHVDKTLAQYRFPPPPSFFPSDKAPHNEAHAVLQSVIEAEPTAFSHLLCILFKPRDDQVETFRCMAEVDLESKAR